MSQPKLQRRLRIKRRRFLKAKEANNGLAPGQRNPLDVRYRLTQFKP